MITIKDGTWNEKEKKSIYDLFGDLNNDICCRCSRTDSEAHLMECGTRNCPYRHIIYDIQCVQDWAEVNRS